MVGIIGAAADGALRYLSEWLPEDAGFRPVELGSPNKLQVRQRGMPTHAKNEVDFRALTVATACIYPMRSWRERSVDARWWRPLTGETSRNWCSTNRRSPSSVPDSSSSDDALGWNDDRLSADTYPRMSGPLFREGSPYKSLEWQRHLCLPGDIANSIANNWQRQDVATRDERSPRLRLSCTR